MVIPFPFHIFCFCFPSVFSRPQSYSGLVRSSLCFVWHTEHFLVLIWFHANHWFLHFTVLGSVAPSLSSLPLLAAGIGSMAGLPFLAAPHMRESAPTWASGTIGWFWEKRSDFGIHSDFSLLCLPPATLFLGITHASLARRVLSPYFQ